MDKTVDKHRHIRFTVEAFRCQQKKLVKSITDLSQVMTMAHTTIAERD